MNLDAQVNISANGVTVCSNGINRVAYLVNVRLEVWDASVLVQEWCEVAYRREPLLLCILNALNQSLSGIAENVVIDTRLVSCLAAQKLIDRNAEILASDVDLCIEIWLATYFIAS